MQSSKGGGATKPKKTTIKNKDETLKKVLAKLPKPGAETKLVESALEKVGNGGEIKVDSPSLAVYTATARSI